MEQQTTRRSQLAESNHSTHMICACYEPHILWYCLARASLVVVKSLGEGVTTLLSTFTPSPSSDQLIHSPESTLQDMHVFSSFLLPQSCKYYKTMFCVVQWLENIYQVLSTLFVFLRLIMKLSRTPQTWFGTISELFPVILLSSNRVFKICPLQPAVSFLLAALFSKGQYLDVVPSDVAPSFSFQNQRDRNAMCPSLLPLTLSKFYVSLRTRANETSITLTKEDATYFMITAKDVPIAYQWALRFDISIWKICSRKQHVPSCGYSSSVYTSYEYRSHSTRFSTESRAHHRLGHTVSPRIHCENGI